MRVSFSAPLRSVVLFLGSLLPMVSVTLAVGAQEASPMKLEGTWQGAVRQPNGSDNRWVVKIEKAGTGCRQEMAWMIDSPDAEQSFK